MLKNSPTHYGKVARALHWLTALLFLLAYVAVYYRQWFTEARTPENWTALQLHLSFGVTIAVLVVLRLYWRLTNVQPEAEPGSALMQKAAHLGHLVLYGVLIVMPLTGYLGTGVATEFFFLFEIPKFADTWLFQTLVADGMGLSFEQFEAPMDFIHKQGGAYLVWLLILGHAAAALYHHYHLKDRTLLKMLPPRR
ncbi:cytochrome b [Alishewanella jeotgali]|uniref:Cytochrome B561 n=1 Tax=Alishewanella jeotgali KCTC 22429 TaxID=1129374 RepID=H3ZI70_9ALTE|nr:cytochrome b [Alishewanella jeotgali]EHR39712.1 cytochrome B561 [Alishewanella jeotgali KCTC 22429]